MGVIALQSINILVIRNFKPSLVVDFNLLFKFYFLLISIAYIIFNPIWSTFTASITKGDTALTTVLLKKSIKISMVMILLVPLMILISDRFIQIWSGTNFHSDLSTNLLFGFWVALVVYSEPFKMLIKGNGELNSFLWIAILSTVLQILLSILLIRNLKYGIDGILLSCIFSQLIYLIFFRLKTKSILIGV
jgi:O-antigen/teichoic acid export membrane protein